MVVKYGKALFTKVAWRTHRKICKTLQHWDKEQRFIAHRSPAQRRYYTLEQYRAYIGMKVHGIKKWGLKDRLARFGFEWFESFCKRHGTVIEVQARMWKLALQDAADTQYKYWEGVFEKVKTGTIYQYYDFKCPSKTRLTVKR